MRHTRWLAVTALVLLGAAVGAFLGGQSVGVCTVGPSVPAQPGTCETDVRLSPAGAVLGALITAGVIGWWRHR